MQRRQTALAVSAPVSNIVTVKLTSSISPSTKFSDGAFYKARFVPNYVRSLAAREILQIALMHTELTGNVSTSRSLISQ